MATAVGAYATLAEVKSQLNIADATDDTWLQKACDRMNGWIESFTGRILAPIPTFAATVQGGGVSIGATSVTLSSATGLNVQDVIVLGPVTGTHEHAIVVDVAGAVATLQAPLIHAYGAGVAVQRIQLLDGLDAAPDGLILPVDNGVVTLTALEVTPTWNAMAGDWTPIPGTDWVLRPTPLGREPGWPATEIHLSPLPSATSQFPFFARYEVSVRAYGRFGWPAIPDEISDLANSGVVTRYKTRGSAGTDSGQVGVDGERTYIRNLSYDEKATLRRYQAKPLLVV